MIREAAITTSAPVDRLAEVLDQCLKTLRE